MRQLHWLGTMLKVHYPAALSGNVDQRVLFLSRDDLVALLAGQPLYYHLAKHFEGRPIDDDLPLVIALGDETDAETERVLSVGAA